MPLVVVAGLAVDGLTSIGQRHLDGVLNPFVNSASAWLVAPFVVGACMATRRGAAAAGLSAGLLQLVGYYVTARLRGHAAGGSIVAFRAACAVLGAAGHLWRRARPPLRVLGTAVLAGAFLAEGLWLYVHELQYHESAALWPGIGVVLASTLSRGPADLRWLALTIPVGLVCELLLDTIYAQSV